MLIEVIVQNKEEAIEAQKLGADRLELVSAIGEGGLTPSFGTIKQVLGSVSIPVQIMIRPHSYHYEYTKSDLDTIYEDIKNVLDLGGTGIVFGALNEDKTINQEVLRNIVSVSEKLDITFHRAFDEVPSQEEAYLTLLKFKQNVQRILTSGGEADCVAGKYNLHKLAGLAKQYNGPKILPGAGLSGNNIKLIHQIVGADQYHFGKAVRKGKTFAEGFDEGEFEIVKKLGGQESL